MSYDIEISDDARRSFTKLDRKIAQRIYTKLKAIADSDNPFLHIKKLTGVELFSLRVGDYRVVLDIRRGKLLILVVKIGHRRNVYEGM